MKNFTAQNAMSLPGSSTLQKTRTNFANQLTNLSIPTSRDELFRYSRIDDINWDNYFPLDSNDVQNLRKENLPGGGPVASEIGERSGLIIFHNGVVVHVEIDHSLIDAGVKVYDSLCPGAFYDEDQSSLRIDSGVDTQYSFLELLRNTFAISRCVIDVPKDVIFSKPIVVLHWNSKDKKSVFPILEIIANKNSNVSIVERYESEPEVDMVVVPATYINAQENSIVDYVQAQQMGSKTINLSRLETFCGKDSKVSTSCISIGGYYSRLRVIANMLGENSSSLINNVYAGSKEQMLDFRTNQNHYGNSSTSELVFKGAVSDNAKSAYSGMIYIDEKASGCNAQQSNKALILSNGAAAYSVPNLEINNDDVMCSHASAVGQVDEEQMYYLALRGFAPDMAKQLIVSGFFDDVLNNFPIKGLVQSLRSEVFRKVSS